MGDETATELYRKHRPRKLTDVIGQTAAIETLSSHLHAKTLPHAIGLIGPSGTGKTTIARILARAVGCDRNDFTEFNTANTRGIDTIRSVMDTMWAGTLGGGTSRVWLFDECHQLTKEAQEAALKMTEDPPDHAYFIFATTNHAKLLPTLRSRLMIVELRAIAPKLLSGLVSDVALREGIQLTKDVLDAIVESAGGSARNALQQLGKVALVKSEDEQLELLKTPATETAAFELIKVLMPFRGKPSWPIVADVLAKIQETEEAEGLRQLVLAVARKTLMNPKQPTRHAAAFAVINAFRDPHLGPKNSEDAVFAANCYEAVQTMSR